MLKQRIFQDFSASVCVSDCPVLGCLVQGWCTEWRCVCVCALHMNVKQGRVVAGLNFVFVFGSGILQMIMQ